MVVTTVSLDSITQLSDLATYLGVDVKALRLVSLHRTVICKRDGCILPAAEHNRSKCILCSQRWFPLSTSAANGRRGYGLYGPKFMRSYQNCKSPPASCCCDTPLCEKIGYSHEGMITLPSKTKCDKDLISFINALGIQDRTLRDKIIEQPRSYRVAPWHISPNHREFVSGKWSLKKMDVYKDRDGKAWPFAPPNHSLQEYIDVEIHEYQRDFEYCRNGYDNELPNWIKKLSRIQKNASPAALSSVTPSTTASSLKTSTTSLSKPKQLTFATPATAPRPRSKRTAKDTLEIMNLDTKLRRVEGEKKSSEKQHTEDIIQLKKIIEELEQERAKALRRVGELTAENTDLKSELHKLKQNTAQLPLTFDDLKPGGVLGKSVSVFTFFPTYEANDAFLELLNFTEECDKGDGLCENMRSYSCVSMHERRKYNGMASDDDMSISSSDEEEDAKEETRGRKRSLDWKTEWLVYCCYVKCGMTMEQILPFFGIGQTKVHNIVYGWANVLCLALKEFFPTPTRSQMLKAYPKSMIRKLGHAKIFQLLDATEWFAEIASMKTVNSILYSTYKHNSTLKFLAGCDPIGIPWADSISEGYPGAVSDPVITTQTDILSRVPYGCAVQVDKGFLIDNECAEKGLICIRPQKMLTGQQQQSANETARHQKVGITRIPVEQMN
eukprot:scaffold145202_cov37-Cyclotella_meneghiniana.AAC.1